MRQLIHRPLAAGRIPGEYAAHVGAALHFVDESLAEVVVRSLVRAYRLGVADGAVAEAILPARVLA